MKNNEKNKKRLIIILLILIIVILLYLLICNFSHIYNHGPLVPTGNVDIFEIDCNCEFCSKDVFNEIDDTNKNKVDEQYKDIVAFDDYKIWDNKQLRIFSNPAYEYESIIAPGSENSYAFVIRNNNNFDIVVDISFKEENEKNINMQYKVRNNGNYLIGTRNNYELINNKTITQIKLLAKSQKNYILDWKWIDSDNDTEIGLEADADYKLSILIEANKK